MRIFLSKAHFFWQRYSGIVLLWLLGGGLSYAAFSTVQYYEEQHSHQQFQASFKDKVTSLTQATSTINKVFLATQSLLEIKRDLAQEDFARLVTHDFLKNTGMLGVQWAPAVEESEVMTFENQVRSSGIFDYQLRRISTSETGCSNFDSQTRFPVLFAQPSDLIGHELGLQLNTNCTIAASMNKALQTHSTSVANFSNDQDELGFRLLLPIFDNEKSMAGKLRGYLVGIVMINQLIDTLWGDLTNSKNYQVSIYSDNDKSQKIYDSQWREQCESGCYLASQQSKLQTTIPFANRMWTIEFTKFSNAFYSQFFAYAVAIFVLMLTSGLSIYLWMHINRVRWANSLVKEQTESLQYQASHDNLTQLLNKRALSNELEKLLSQQNSHNHAGFSLLFIDLDHFKKVNDTKGHLVGDKLLQQVAQRLKQTARHHDLLFRFGGDEFAVLLHNSLCQVTITLVAERILKRLEQIYIIDDNKYRIGASIGVSVSENLNTSAHEVIRNADIAMYEAKRLGRGQVVFYQANMHQSLMKKQSIEDELADAISNNQLSLYLQPIHENRELKGFEALSRWYHPDKGVIFPDEFIAVAEETGLIHPLGKWLIDSACSQLAKWLQQYSEENCPYISINISPIQLAQTEVVEQIAKALMHYNVPGKLLAVELTESALIDNKVIVKKNLAYLQKLDVRIFLDDFGTGFSSLSLLRDFPIDVLKIDRSFIFDIANTDLHQGSQKLVKAMINMAKALNMQVVAEGVEDIHSLNWLNEAGCHLMQGYYLSKPLPPKPLNAYLAEQKSKNVTLLSMPEPNYSPDAAVSA
ncbi:MAG: EAL domain-containing protein [Colwellia sp.]|nr:EAL domain-containing protein [Colwellia sp.]